MYHYHTFVFVTTAGGYIHILDDYLNGLAAKGWRIVNIYVAGDKVIEILAEKESLDADETT